MATKIWLRQNVTCSSYFGMVMFICYLVTIFKEEKFCKEQTICHNQSINQLINQPINQSINQSIKVIMKYVYARN